MDIRPFYLEQGDGEPLILLHGNGESSDYFKHQMPVFSQRYHVFAVDTRGHGQTPRGTEPFTLSQFADDLRDFLDAQGIAQAHILGFSDGGNIALLFALRYPERVKTLILNGANLAPTGVRRRYQWPIELGYRLTKRFARRSEEAAQHHALLALMVEEPHIHCGKAHPADCQQHPGRTALFAERRPFYCRKAGAGFQRSRAGVFGNEQIRIIILIFCLLFSALCDKI